MHAAVEQFPLKWTDKLARRGERILGDERNVDLAFRHAPQLIGLVRFNEFSHAVEFSRVPPWRNAHICSPWMDDDDTGCLRWLQTQGVEIRQKHIVADTVAFLAKEESYHPVRDYLAGLRWDGVPRVQIWLAEYLNAQADPVYLNAVGRKWLISAVARILSPGCQADHVLVLEGPQGIGKSRTARALARSPAWFADHMPDIRSTDAMLQLCGRWIVELAELAATRRAELEAVKAYISRPVDVFRPPYARRPITVPRQCVFIATTNEAHYLRDPTGNRRFWPVTCGRIDLDALERDRDQLWAEAVMLYQKGNVWHLTAEESALAAEEQSERVLVTELEANVSEYLARLESIGVSEIDTRQVMVEALHVEPDKSDFAERAGRLGPAVAAALHAAGWQKVRTSGRGKHRRNIYRKAPMSHCESHRGSQGHHSQ